MTQRILLLLVVFSGFSSCTIEEHAGKNPYLTKIFSWSSFILKEDFKQLPDFEENNFYILWDQQNTCAACTIPLIDILKEFPEVTLLRNFEKEEDIELFREAYKVSNKIYRLEIPSRYSFETPFAFKFDKLDPEDEIQYTIRRIFILEEEYLTKSHFKRYLDKNKKGVYMEYHPKDWLIDWISRGF